MNNASLISKRLRQRLKTVGKTSPQIGPDLDELECAPESASLLSLDKRHNRVSAPPPELRRFVDLSSGNRVLSTTGKSIAEYLARSLRWIVRRLRIISSQERDWERCPCGTA
jgi:hypothetical protein